MVVPLWQELVDNARPRGNTCHPEVGDVVIHPEYGAVYVSGGQYEREGRTSNVWYFRQIERVEGLEDGTFQLLLSSERNSGYGGDWPLVATLLRTSTIVYVTPAPTQDVL
jgi:hypothetical protein